jgi:mannose-6-phosphate isomerase-like protein (cupin superfamily)
MLNFVANMETAKKDEGVHSFKELLNHKEDKVLRDSFILLDKENTGSDNLTVGSTIVYPGARTGGHAHVEVEEVYYITKGKGKMIVDEAEFEVKAGDAFWVNPGAFHITFNTGLEPLEYVWVLSKWDRK